MQVYSPLEHSYEEHPLVISTAKKPATSTWKVLLAVLLVIVFVLLVLWGSAATFLWYQATFGPKEKLIDPKYESPNVLDIISYNDVYELEPVKVATPYRRGGASRVLRYIKDVKQKKKYQENTLVLGGGDMISPRVYSTIFKGKQMIDANNLLQLNFTAIGNHEFDFDVETFRQRLVESKFLWLNSNIKGLPFATIENHIYDFNSNVRIGLFGVCLDFNRADRSYTIVDPLVAAAEQVAKLKEKGATFIIALVHLSAAASCAVTKVPGINLVISGHDHMMKVNADCGPGVFVTASQDWQDIWHLQVDFNYTSKPLIRYESIQITEDLPTDPDMDRLIDGYKEKLSKELDVRICETKVELNGLANEIRTKETNLGDYIADKMRTHFSADTSLFTGGSIRCNTLYEAGKQILKGDVIRMLPFTNTIGTILINGTNLKEAMENGVSGVARRFGGFPLISGFNFTFTLDQPVGSRVLAMSYKNQTTGEYHKVLPHHQFSMVTTAFLSDGGDGYTMLIPAKRLVDPDQGTDLTDVILEAMKSEGVITQMVDGRVTQV